MTSLREGFVTTLKSLFRGKSFLKALVALWTASPPAPPAPEHAGPTPVKVSADADAVADFLAEAERLFLGYISAGGLRELSRNLKRQFRERLLSDPACMLPSYNSQLPTGRESGQYLALDVGGSTLRVALVELKGRGGESRCQSRIVRMDSFKIDHDVRNLRGFDFFHWMAERIHRTVASESENGHSPERPLLVGLAWSFPIEYESPASQGSRSLSSH